jgi:hypothetical protein
MASGIVRTVVKRTGGGGKQEADVATDHCLYPDLGRCVPWDQQMVT